MFWKYTLFETKILLHNRKNWFVASCLLLFFLVFFINSSQEEPMSLKDQKREEARIMNATFDHIEVQREDVPEISEIYDILTKQSSLINFQVYYLGIGDDSEQYIENGLELNQLRLKVHELGNKGIPDYLITPREEILKENALLNYMKDHKLPIGADSFLTNYYFVNALQAMSGLLFLTIILISGSELLVFEQRHRTLVKGFPISFMKKVNAKVAVHFIYIYSFLLIGFLIGWTYAVEKLNAKDFSFPVLIYKTGDYVAVSTAQYLVFIILGMALVTVVLQYFSILLNMLFQNAFANLLVGLGIYYLPDLLVSAGMNTSYLHPIKFINIAGVLSGDLAIQLGNSSIDYKYAIILLMAVTIFLNISIYLINTYSYRRKPKDVPLEKVF